MLNDKRALSGRLAILAAGIALAAAPAFAAASTAISSGKVKRGTVVVSKSGLTLYGFTKDSSKSSACNGGCASTWVPWIANGSATVKAGSGLTQSLVGTITRTNGKKQITYGGHPLYHFTGDTKAGQQNGEAQKLNGGNWYVISKAGKFLKPSSGLIGGY
jgi:predicted lipoprotein with Yx(FWY)xxD motif